MELKKIKGIGEKTEKDLNRLGILRAEDLLTYYPKRYEKFDLPTDSEHITEGKDCAVLCIFKSYLKLNKSSSQKLIVSGTAYDQKGNLISVKWFNMPYLSKTIFPRNPYVLYGTFKRTGNNLSITQPRVYKPEEYMHLTKNLQPIYSLKSGIKNTTLRKCIKTTYEMDIRLVDLLTDDIKEKYDLYEKNAALYNLHFPRNEETLKRARKRICFDEFFDFFVNLRVLREDKIYETNNHVIPINDATREIINCLPYDLTTPQLNAISDIFNDMKGPTTMNRLIEGDVGSGKTIIAILAMINTAFAGYQSAIMVPTEVLAIQHYENILAFVDRYSLDIDVELLTGSTKSAKKKEVLSKLKDGSTKIIIGTHALISENVIYSNLALVITDEQHRFGVKQRDDLDKKGNMPHNLIMSATPIPRTLAKMIYGDMSISVIDSLPSNRIPIKNAVVNEAYRNRCYKLIYDEIKKKHQAYIICPMVDENEELDVANVLTYTEDLKEIFKGEVTISYLHGKMTPADKNQIMEDFSRGDIDILVSTTVIEVGINVPNATVIMIENAERFGLSQLHQLRGRVGRGEFQSYCIFINGNENDESKKRLDIIGKTNNGFEIAEEDLALRGPGDLFGVRQSGDLIFEFGDIYSDSDMLKLAKNAADNLSKVELTKYAGKSCFYLT